jgi:DNA-binding HxlR family transcriptional regulator
MEQASCKTGMLPIRDTLDVVSGKWKLIIIFHLKDGSKRFKELQREIVGITPRMLSKELKDLEQHELVRREVFDTSPISVLYTLTKHGETLCPVIHALQEWGQKHRQRILQPEEVLS